MTHRLMKSSKWIFCLLTLLGWLAAGCANVKPWERGALAETIMQPDRDPVGARLAEHVYFSREAAASGRSVGGGGCGCN